VLKHGRYNYHRVSTTVLLFMYKNLLLTLLFFLFIFLSDYSGANLFNSGLLLFYNVLFTTLPVMVLGVLD
jgi:magnesium-transporting ATPase (P-type)